MKKEEYSLVYKAIHGDSHAYGELIHQYNPYFYKIAFLYVKNEDAAVEIVQDSVYQGYLKIKTLRNPELFSTWMTRIIMNKAVRYIKQNKKIVEYEEAFHEASHSEHVEEKLDLMNAVNRLPKKYKDVIIQKYFLEMSVEEIAKKQMIPENTVKTNLSRARADLKKMLVYISHPTEYGTLYTKAELEALHAVCQEYKMPLFLDGARLGYGLAAEGTDVTLADLARLTDVFYIGGTKVGALCGEAVVFPHGAPAHFMTMVKQQGALLAKGRLLGIQFDVLFTDGLYFSISKNAIVTANRLKAGFAEKGYRFFMDSPTNQIFLVLENAQLAALEGKAKFGFWEKFDDTHTVVRIATSWATRMDEVEALIDLM